MKARNNHYPYPSCVRLPAIVLDGTKRRKMHLVVTNDIDGIEGSSGDPCCLEDASGKQYDLPAAVMRQSFFGPGPFKIRVA